MSRRERAAARLFPKVRWGFAGARAAAAPSWDLDIETTLMRRLAANATDFPQQVAMREKDRGIWQELSWSDVLEVVLRCAAGLQAQGLGPGKGVLVLGDNRANSSDSAARCRSESSTADCWRWATRDGVVGKAAFVFWPVGRWSGL